MTLTSIAGAASPSQVPGWGPSGESLRPAVAVPERGYKLITASSVKAREIVWMLPDRIPYGGLSVIFGPAGQGKSQLTLALAAQLSRQGIDTIFVGAEDALDDTIKPRLMAAGAETHRFHQFVAIDEQGREDVPLLPTDVPLLEKAVREKQAKLVIVDPVKGHLAPELNENSDHSLRQALVPLARMSQSTGASVITVLHPRKGREGTLLERIGGGAGFGGVARSVLLFGRRRQDDEFCRVRYLAHIKCNGAPLAPPLELTVDTVAVQEGGQMIRTSAVTIGEEAPGVRAEDLE